MVVPLYLYFFVGLGVYLDTLNDNAIWIFSLPALVYFVYLYIMYTKDVIDMVYAGMGR